MVDTTGSKYQRVRIGNQITVQATQNEVRTCQKSVISGPTCKVHAMSLLWTNCTMSYINAATNPGYAFNSSFLSIIYDNVTGNQFRLTSHFKLEIFTH